MQAVSGQGYERETSELGSGEFAYAAARLTELDFGEDQVYRCTTNGVCALRRYSKLVERRLALTKK